MDVATIKEVTLTDSQVQCIPTDMEGPLGYGLSALLLGRSSITRRGLFVLPGVIDADYTGPIKIMVWTPTPPVHIPAGTRIGQVMPFKAAVPTAGNQVRGDKGFGSTGNADIYLALEISKTKPLQRVALRAPGGQKCVLDMLVDTGADVTIISQGRWPPSWPVEDPAIPIMGVGGTQTTRISKEVIQCQMPDGGACSIRPYVPVAPVCLLGRDALSQLGACLTTGGTGFLGRPLGKGDLF